jgi:hypothetical protein
MKNKLTDLRDHLFATLESLQDKENPMELDRAKVIATVAKEITETAKVEVDFLRVTGQSSASGFLPAASKPDELGTPAAPRLVRGSAQP